jgi:two-component system copper resistance phosphate regulon response regulator CusR
MRVLVVEDNVKMGQFIRQGLTEQGYSVDLAGNGEDGEHLGATEPYDVIILDVMLPDQDGIRVCKNLRRRKVATPILMLTALSSTSDKVSGLDAGADDYVPKPFEFVELVARVRALVRRGQAQESTTLRFADIEMDLLTRKVTRGGRPIRLTSKEFALLEYLLRNPNRVLSRAAISEHVWDMNFDNDSNVIDVYVSTLRRKIDRGFSRQLIKTVVGAGYLVSDDGEET